MIDVNKKLLIAVGNEARGDDGMAWKFSDEVQQLDSDGWKFIERYELNTEDAEVVSSAEMVVFVDSFSSKLEKGYLMEECHPRVNSEYDAHILNPCAVLAKCSSEYKRRPIAFVLRLQGFKWGLGKGLSEAGLINVEKAVAYFQRKFLLHDFV